MNQPPQDDTATDDYRNDFATFGDRIAAAREAMGMSPAELSRRLGVKMRTLQNWESDRSEPRANRLQMLAGLLNVPIVWLMNGDGPGPRATRSEPASDPGELIGELSRIRALQDDLAARTRRLERRLIEVLNARTES